jgi:hypothetical protein
MTPRAPTSHSPCRRNFRDDQSKAVSIEKQKPLAGLLDGAL